MLRKIAVFLAAAFIICSFSACTVQEIDELYSLPQPREEYLQLQALIDAEIAAGSELGLKAKSLIEALTATARMKRLPSLREMRARKSVSTAK